MNALQPKKYLHLLKNKKVNKIISFAYQLVFLRRRGRATSPPPKARRLHGPGRRRTQRRSHTSTGDWVRVVWGAFSDLGPILNELLWFYEFTILEFSILLVNIVYLGWFFCCDGGSFFLLIISGWISGDGGPCKHSCWIAILAVFWGGRG